MKFKPYTNRAFEVVGVTPAPPKSRQIDPQGLYFTYILPDFDRSMWLKYVDSYRMGSYVHVE